MALLERLQILIDADAKGAQREFQNIGRTADKELGKAEDRIGRTSARLQSMGSAAAIGGGAVLVGLGMLAKSADEADRQVLKLENSIKNSDQAFRNNGQSLQDLAQDLQKVTAADGDAIIGAQSLLVQFGATEAQIGKLTPLVVDLSQKMGISLEAAAKAVGKSLDGSGGALKKMGINVDETALKTDAATATFDALNQTVGGFARVEGATFSGQLQILKNNVGDLGEAVGSGAAGVLGSLAGQAAGAAGALNELNPGILTAAGGLGTTAALAVTLGGGFAVAAGKALEMRDTLRPIGDDGARSLSKVGKAAAGIAIVGAVVGIVETVATVANSVNDIDSKLAAGTDKFRGSLTGTNAEMGRAFAGLVEIEDKSAEFSGIWEGFGAKVSLGDFTADIEEVEKAFSSTLDTFGPAAAQRVLDDLKRQNEGLAKSSDQYKTNNDFIRASQKQVDARSEAVVQATVAEKAATKAQEAAIAAEEERQSTMQAVTDGLTLYDAKVKLFTATMGAADAAGRGFSESIDASSRLDDQASSALKLAEASEYLGFIVGFLPKEYDLATLALGGYTDEQETSIGKILEFGEAAKTALADALVSGQNPTMLGAALREKLTAALQEANIPPEQISEYIGMAGLSEQQIEVAIKVGVAEEEYQKFVAIMAFFQASGDELSPQIRPYILEAQLRGEFDKANALIAANQAALDGDPMEVQTALGPYPELAPLQAELQRQADARKITQQVEVQYNLGTITPDQMTGKGPVPKPKKYGLPNPVETALNYDINGNGVIGNKMGGNVRAGQEVMVNEIGREMFTPSTAGFITTAADSQRLFAGLEQLLAGASSSGGDTFNIAATEPREVAAEIVLTRDDRRWSRGGRR